MFKNKLRLELLQIILNVSKSGLLTDKIVKDLRDEIAVMQEKNQALLDYLKVRIERRSKITEKINGEEVIMHYYEVEKNK